MINKKNKEISLFIYPTYRCLDNCSFCFIKPALRKKPNELSLDEIKANLSYFEKKYQLRDIVLVGGEPFLYKDIIPLMEFLWDRYILKQKTKGFLIATSALKCSSIEFTRYLKKFFKSDSNISSCLQISLNSFSPKDRFFKQKKSAILNLAKEKISVRYILVFTRYNMEDIKKATDFLIDVFLNYYSNLNSRNFVVELRIPFNPINLVSNKKRKFVPEASVFLKSFQDVSSLFLKNHVLIGIRNIPFCYLKEYNRAVLGNIYKTNAKMLIARINKWRQLDKALVSSYNSEKWGIQKKCDPCRFREKCNGIDPIFIKKIKYPSLKPFL